MIYYIADTHFGDERVMRLAKRPFNTVEEMDCELIARWNGRVLPQDEVYIVGDFAVNDFTAKQILPVLNGRKSLILGNHDRLSEQTLICFKKVDKIMTIDDGGRSVCLCHYPLLSYGNSVYGGYHVFGHIHNNADDVAFDIVKRIPRIYNCGVDENEFEPKTLDELMGRGK